MLDAFLSKLMILSGVVQIYGTIGPLFQLIWNMFHMFLVFIQKVLTI